MFIGKYNRTIILTYVGVISAVIGMYFAAAKQDFKMAIICLVISGICDLFDGKVARMCKRTKDDVSFGIQLDSLADTIDFVVFPVVFGLALGLNEWHHIIGYCIICMGGVQRLAHFNVLVMNKKDDKPVKCYSGLPVTSTSITFPFIWLIYQLTWISFGAYKIVYIILVYLTGVLFVTNISVPKFKGIAYPILAVLALAAVIALVFTGV